MIYNEIISVVGIIYPASRICVCTPFNGCLATPAKTVCLVNIMMEKIKTKKKR